MQGRWDIYLCLSGRVLSPPGMTLCGITHLLRADAARAAADWSAVTKSCGMFKLGTSGCLTSSITPAGPGSAVEDDAITACCFRLTARADEEKRGGKEAPVPSRSEGIPAADGWQAPARVACILLRVMLAASGSAAVRTILFFY